MEDLKQQIRQRKKSLDNVNREFEDTNDMVKYKRLYSKYSDLISMFDVLDVTMYDSLKRQLKLTENEVNYFVTKYTK